ncbi:MAG: hypothetical protein N4A61_12700 [Pelagimonas sp.]|jgi:hypothetical protein|nr:hypothetical protein [Pelagimonas sp.]
MVNLARDWLLDRNPDYGLAATGDWHVFPTRQPIFYRKDRLTLLDQGGVYFEDDTEVARQTQYREFWIYYCSWAKFADHTGAEFTVYNLHFHYHDPNKRLEAANRLAAHVRPLIAKGETVFVLGDTNSLDDWAALRVLRDAGLQMLQDKGATFHFNAGLGLFGGIDRIGAVPGARVLGGPWVISRRFQGQFPSDHYPVAADFALPE